MTKQKTVKPGKVPGKQITWTPRLVNVSEIKPTEKNYKIKTKLGVERLRESLKSFGMAGTTVVNTDMMLIDGNSRLEEAIERGEKKMWVSMPDRKLSASEFSEMSAMFDFAKAGEVDMERIEGDLGTTKDFFDKYRLSVPAHILDNLGNNAPIVKGDGFEDNGKEVVHTILRDKFIEPPFSVLDTKTGNWQRRRSEWNKLDMKSEVGRDDKLTFNISINEYHQEDGLPSQTSIFDPALTELMYHWFCPKHGQILDPFAGGSVRGIVAHYLGFKYTGIDLSRRQVDSNMEQARKILKSKNQPVWYLGDSDKVLDKKFVNKFDLIFSCPPYADLEVYSKHKDDLSNMKYKDFLPKYRSIIKKSLALLKPKSYAVFVVGEVRGKDGFYYDFISDTKRAFIDAGAKFYNDAVLLNMVGSAAIRTKQFEKSKKLVKTHQNVLIFYKA